MTLNEFLKDVREKVTKNPELLNMELWVVNSSSGAAYEAGHVYMDKFDEQSECGPWKSEMNEEYPYDTFVRISTN